MIVSYFYLGALQPETLWEVLPPLMRLAVGASQDTRNSRMRLCGKAEGIWNSPARPQSTFQCVAPDVTTGTHPGPNPNPFNEKESLRTLIRFAAKRGPACRPMLNKRPYARKPRISARIARTFVLTRRRKKKRVRAFHSYAFCRPALCRRTQFQRVRPSPNCFSNR
jgi:hypothetical protein